MLQQRGLRLWFPDQVSSVLSAAHSAYGATGDREAQRVVERLAAAFPVVLHAPPRPAVLVTDEEGALINALPSDYYVE